MAKKDKSGKRGRKSPRFPSKPRDIRGNSPQPLSSFTDASRPLPESAELILLPTPIGNSGDLSPRAAEALERADGILCEDTRVTGLLLAELGIKNNLLSCHEHNQYGRLPQIAAAWEEGKVLALVSDAGMPLISDPGAPVLRLAVDMGCKITSLPGPNAALCALQASGLSTAGFLFLGFLPPKGKERREKMELLRNFPYTIILYEAPHKLRKTLAALREAGLGNRRICLAREMTKKYEEFLRMSVDEASGYYEELNPKGEFVLVMEGTKEWEKRMSKSLPE